MINRTYRPKIYRLTTVFMALIFCITFASYSGGQYKSADISANSGVTITDASVAGISLWSAPSTEKILQNMDYAQGGATTSLNLSMTRGEQESVQLIITAQKDISYFKLSASDLTDSGGNRISAGDIEIYQQHYIEVLSASPTGYYPGWWPDALIPADKTIEYGENVIKSGYNQGLWIKVRTYSATTAGDYSGIFRLEVGSYGMDIPVNVKVWDIDISQEPWPETSFLLYNDYFIQSEFDGSYDMWTSYYEYFLDYGISLMGMPMQDGQIDSFVDNVKKYDDRISSYSLPYNTSYFMYPNGWFRPGPDFENLTITIKKLIVASVEDGKDYLSKAYMYNIYIDEYNAIAYGQTRLMLAQVFAEQFSKTLKGAVDFFDGVYGTGYIDAVDGLRNSALNVKNISVSAYVEEVTPKYNTFCPPYNLLQLKEDREFYSSIWNGEDNYHLWWYTCLGRAPDPTYLIDDALVDERLVSWMQYDYNVAGNLYWAVNYHRNKATHLPDDEWTNAGRSTANRYNGDGWLSYPGEKYGIKGPIGTVRLEAIRDGMEEYRMLKVLQKTYDGFSEQYGLELNTDNAMRHSFNMLYQGVAYTKDTALFDAQRNALAETILMAQSQAKVVFADYTETALGFEFKLLTAEDAEFTSSQTTAQENLYGGTLYTLFCQKSESDSVLQFSYNDGQNTVQFTKFLQKGIHSATTFDSEAHINFVRVSGAAGTEINGITKAPDGKDALKLTLNTYNEQDTITKRASFSLLPQVFDDSFSDVDVMYLDLYNASDENLEIVVTQVLGLYDVSLVTVSLTAGQWTQIKIMNLTEKQDTLAFRFSMPARADKQYQLFIGGLTYSKV